MYRLGQVLQKCGDALIERVFGCQLRIILFPVLHLLWILFWFGETAPTADVKMYVLRSLVSEELSKKYIETPETASFSGFALVVVGILQLAGDKVPEGLS